MNRVILCSTCARDGRDEFIAALRARVPAGVAVETVECMNQCDRPMALALRGTGKDVYLFADVDPAADLADTLALIELYRAAPGGTIADARPAGRLRFCLTGRVPG